MDQLDEALYMPLPTLRHVVSRYLFVLSVSVLFLSFSPGRRNISLERESVK